MKKMLDKPYKTVLYITTLLLLSTISLKGDNSITTKIVNDLPIIEVTQKSEPVDNVIVVAETHVDEIALAKQIRKEKPINRGGSPIKQLTEKEKIVSYIKEISAKYDMDPELIMSVVYQESRFNPNAKNGNCLGLMQISKRWHADRAARLGVKNFYDPYGNILLGVDYLSELRVKYKDMRLVLMLYNMDHKTAISKFKSGQISNYAKSIIARSKEYKKGE